MFKVPNQHRIKSGMLGSDDSVGKYGAFIIPFRSVSLKVIASCGDEPETKGWEHVSVSLGNRCPNWEEMCFVKSLFWDDEDTVVQFHPAKSQYVNVHPNCLHLWRNAKKQFITPPIYLVG